MKFYNIFLKKDDNGVVKELILLKYGFSLPAFVFNVFWLLYKRCFILGFVSIVTLYVTSTFISASYFVLISLFFSIILGFEANRILTKKYIREDYKYLGCTSGNNEIEAKRRFLDSINKESNIE